MEVGTGKPSAQLVKGSAVSLTVPSSTVWLCPCVWERRQGPPLDHSIWVGISGCSTEADAAHTPPVTVWAEKEWAARCSPTHLTLQGVKEEMNG